MPDNQEPETPPGIPKVNLEQAIVALDDDKSELDKIMELLLDPQNIAQHTELNRNEILAFSVLSTLAKKYNLTVLRDFLAENLMLRVSKGRAGKKEFVKMVSRQLSFAEQDPIMQQKKGIGGFFRRR